MNATRKMTDLCPYVLLFRSNLSRGVVAFPPNQDAEAFEDVGYFDVYNREQRRKNSRQAFRRYVRWSSEGPVSQSSTNTADMGVSYNAREQLFSYVAILC